MKKKLFAALAILLLLCAMSPRIQQAAASAAEELESIVVSARYALEVTEPTLTQYPDGRGRFTARLSFGEAAEGSSLKVAAAFYDSAGRLQECWLELHTLAEGSELSMEGPLPDYASVGVYFFDSDTLIPIRPAVMRALDCQAQVKAADLEELRQAMEEGFNEQAQAVEALEQQLLLLQQELDSLKEQLAEERAAGSPWRAADRGVLPGRVDMDKMNALLSQASEQGASIQFDDGVYEFSDTLTIGSDTSLLGSADTVFSLCADSTAATLMSIGSRADNIYLAHLTLQGPLGDAPAAEGSLCGLRIDGAVRVHIENVEFAGFDQCGLYASNMASTEQGEFYKALRITNCRFYDNYCGMRLGQRCEYTQVLNCVFGKNYTGCLNQGGNNAYTSCIFNVNTVGFQMDSKGLSNPAHGGCNACTFNHNAKPIIVNDCSIGWIFSGCQIFYGRVELNESSGVVFDGSIFGSCTVNSRNPDHRNANLISDCYFQTDSQAILSGNDGSVYVTDCLPDRLPADELSGEEAAWTQLLYTQESTAASGASVDAYFAPISHRIPENASIDVIDIVIRGASAEGQLVKDVDLWLGNAATGELTEQIVCGEDLSTVYSPLLREYVLRIRPEKSYAYPVFVAMEAERTGGRGIAYSRSSQAVNHFNGTGLSVGDILSANSTYIPEFAVYSTEGAAS